MAEITYGLTASGETIAGLAEWDIMPSGAGSELAWERLVLASLFTDGRADDSAKLPDGGKDRRGWWGDTYTTGTPAASVLWLVAGRAGPTAREIEDAARAALAWIVADDLADVVTVTATLAGRRADIAVEIVAQGESVVVRVPALWSEYAS